MIKKIRVTCIDYVSFTFDNVTFFDLDYSKNEILIVEDYKINNFFIKKNVVSISIKEEEK